MNNETEKAKVIVNELHAAKDQIADLNKRVASLTDANSALQVQVDGLPKAIADATATLTNQVAQRDATIADLHDKLADYVTASAILDAEIPDVAETPAADVPPVVQAQAASE